MAIDTVSPPQTAATDTGITEALAQQAASTTFEGLPGEIVTLAKQCFLDWLGVTIAGASEPLAGILLEEVDHQGGRPQATIIGHGRRVPAMQAALVNGTLSHALDYDDVNLAVEGHPSAPIIPGVLALAESRGASGKDFIAAFVAGYEAACRAGLLVAPGHYEAGFHATGTIGAFGSAAGCARLMGLDAGQTAQAMGIAGTQAAGLKAMFGTMCKPLHAGKAAQNGLLAAALAARGFDSRRDVLECEQGFAETQSNNFNPETALAEPAGGYHMRANLFKYHAACYLTHASIECCHKIRSSHAVDPAAIRQVDLKTGAGCDRVCHILEPKTGLEAKFSLRLIAAMALAGVDTAALASYSDAHCADPALTALRDKVTASFETKRTRTMSSVAVTMDDGQVYEASHDSGVAAEDFAEQGRRLVSKFQSLVEPVLGQATSADLVKCVNDLEELGNLDPILEKCSRGLGKGLKPLV